MKLLAQRLEGKWINMDPLQEKHRHNLSQAANCEEVWTNMPFPAMGDKFNPWFDKALEDTTNQIALAYVVIDKNTHQILGSTRYYQIATEHKRLALGHTWFIPVAWATPAYVESQYLMLAHAFENLDALRVEFYTDACNMPMQSAIKSIGAKQEAILEGHMIREDGSIRRTIQFRMLQEEWAAAKTTLQGKLEL